MITALYATICAGILMQLAMNVIKFRRKYRVSLGGGDVEELEAAIATHSNASEYIPISLILLFFLEVNEASLWLVNIFGIILIAGRCFHAYGMLNKLSARVLGMQLTIYNIMAMGVVNLIVLALL